MPFALEVCSAWGWQHASEHVPRIAAGMRTFL